MTKLSLICSGPCDIAGDISYDELRALAYDDYKHGKSLQAIVGEFAIMIFRIGFCLALPFLCSLHLNSQIIVCI